MRPSLLVVAGEASGDRAAAGVVSVLRETLRLRAVGMGGAALAATGVSLVCDLRETTSMGLGAVAGRAGRIALSASRVMAASRQPDVRAALLVNYSEFNARLAPFLHARGIHVVWYGAPQIWAWRAERADALRNSVDRMAVMLPFEEALWRGRGMDARYVGHPAREGGPLGRAEARALLGLTDLAKTVAILPGSRPHEVDALLDPMLASVDRVRRDRASIDARLLLAPSLDSVTREAARALAETYGVASYDVPALRGAAHVLAGFDVAVTASGTATLEAALARAVPVVAYRVGVLTELVARALVRTELFALPNVLLGRKAFAELLQRDVTDHALASAIARSLDSRDELVRACDEVERILGDKVTPSREVAEMLLPWLTPPSTDR